MSSFKDSKHNVEDAAEHTDAECESLLHHIEAMRLKQRLSQSPVKVSPAIKVTLSSGHRSTACAAGLELDSPVPPAASPTTTVSAFCNSPTDTSGASSSLDTQQQQEVFESKLISSLHQLTISEESTSSNNDNGRAHGDNVNKARVSADEASPTSTAPSTHSAVKSITTNNNSISNNDNPLPTPLPLPATDTAAVTATDLSAWQMMMPTPGKLSLPSDDNTKTTTTNNKKSNSIAAAAAASKVRAAPSSYAYAPFPSPPPLLLPHRDNGLVEDQNYNSQQLYSTNNSSSYLNTYHPYQPSQAVQGASISSLGNTAAGLGYAPSAPPPPPPPPPPQSSSSFSGRPLAPLHYYQQQQQGQQQSTPLSASAASFYQPPPPPLPTSYLTGDVPRADGDTTNNNNNKYNNNNNSEDFQGSLAAMMAQQEQQTNMQLLVTAYNNNPIPFYGAPENSNNVNNSNSNENQGGHPYASFSSSSFPQDGTGSLGLGGLAVADPYLYNSLATASGIVGNMMMNDHNSNTTVSHSSQSHAPRKSTTNNAAGMNINGDTIDPQLMSLLFQQQHQLLQLQQQEQRELFAMTEPEECLVGLEGLYQPYCSQIITQNLNTTTFSLLSKLRDSQLTDPPNAYYGKRFFCSLKEVSKVVYRGCQAIIVAPDVKPSTTANIKPVRLLHSILQAATDSGVPIIFALSRRGIGRVFGRDKSMSIVAVMMIDGVEREFADMLSYAAEGRKEYRRYSLNNNSNGY